jgi:hypothetical protein
MFGNSFYKLPPERPPGHKTKVQYAEEQSSGTFSGGLYRRLAIRQLAQSNEANNNSAVSA